MYSIFCAFVSLAVTCSARRVQTGIFKGAREWEMENMALSDKGLITDAELGLLNLKNAMKDPSLLKEMAQGLRNPEGSGELVKMMANPRFQEQAKRVADTMRATSVFADFLKVESYGKEQDSPKTLQSVLLALNPAGAVRGHAAQKQSRTGSV